MEPLLFNKKNNVHEVGFAFMVISTSVKVFWDVGINSDAFVTTKTPNC